MAKRSKEKRKPARWLRDHEVQDARPEISASRLRKDRRGAQLFPFHRVGRDCLYDLAEIDAIIEKNRFGGKAA
jgi:hypothetical protein